MSAPDCHCHSCTQKCHQDIEGHFISAKDCRLVLHDGAGKFCISTVGDYRPFDSRDKAYPIGCDRLYETMVFDKSRESDRWSELEMRGYETEAEARAGHAEVLAKYRSVQ